MLCPPASVRLWVANGHLCPRLSIRRTFITSTANRVYMDLAPKDTPASGVAINTRIKKLNFPPFVKDLFVGVFNKSVLSYAEVLNYGRHLSLEQKVKDIESYLETKKDALEKIDRTGKMPPEVLLAFKQSGMFGLSVPTEYGGADFLHTEIARILEVLGKEISLAEYMNYNEFLGGCEVLVQHGTEDQKQKYLTQLSSGSLLGAFCLADESAGSDPASVEVSATLSPNGDSYLLNGTKVWVAGADQAGLFTVFAKLGMKNYLGEEDNLLTAFLVDKTIGGIEVSQPRRLNGLKGLDLCDVTFRDCEVPVSCLLGEEGEGLSVLASIHHHNKFLMAAGLITHLRGLLDQTIEWINHRKQFGLRLSEFKLVKHQIGQMAARLYCLESMVYLTAGLRDVAEVPDVEVESAIIKLYAAETSEMITKGCLNLLGMRACMEDSKYQRYLRDNQVIQSWQGTNNILKCFVAINGLIHMANQEGKFELKKIRQPYTWMGKNLAFYWNSRKHMRDKFPLSHKLSGCVHPILISSAENVEWSVHKLHWVAKEMLFRKGANMQVEEKYLERLANITIEVFASVSCLSRASRSYVVGHTHAEHEVRMAIPYIFESRIRVNENVWKCIECKEDKDKGNRDMFWEETGNYVTARGGYQAVHPLTKNSF